MWHFATLSEALQVCSVPRRFIAHDRRTTARRSQAAWRRRVRTALYRRCERPLGAAPRSLQRAQPGLSRSGPALPRPALLKRELKRETVSQRGLRSVSGWVRSVGGRCEAPTQRVLVQLRSCLRTLT